MFSGIKFFLSQFLTRKSVLGLIIRAIRPSDVITRDLPHQFEQLSHVC